MINLYFNNKLHFAMSNSFNILIYFAYKPLFCIWLYGLSFGYIYAVMVQLNG